MWYGTGSDGKRIAYMKVISCLYESHLLELYLLTPKNDQRNKGIMEAHPKGFASDPTALNCIGWHNDNDFAYLFELREKGYSRRLMQKLRENILCLPSPALFRRWQSWRINVLDNYAGSFQEAIADTWREKFSNVNVAMRNVNISV